VVRVRTRLINTFFSHAGDARRAQRPPHSSRLLSKSGRPASTSFSAPSSASSSSYHHHYHHIPLFRFHMETKRERERERESPPPVMDVECQRFSLSLSLSLSLGPTSLRDTAYCTYRPTFIRGLSKSLLLLPPLSHSQCRCCYPKGRCGYRPSITS